MLEQICRLAENCTEHSLWGPDVPYVRIEIHYIKEGSPTSVEYFFSREISNFPSIEEEEL